MQSPGSGVPPVGRVDLRDLLALCREETASEADAQADFWALVKERAATDLRCYGLYVHGRDSRIAYQAAMSMHFRVIDEMLVRSDRALIVTPPEHWKSTLMRWHIEQWIGQETEAHFRDPDHPVPRAILAMNAAKQAWRQVKAIAATLEGHPRYLELFPNVKPDRPWGWSSEELYIKRIKPLPEPTLFGCGVRGAIQGMHAGLGVVDDPTDQEDARSPKVLDEQIEWRLGVYSDRLLENALQRDIMTRWTDNDIFETLSGDKEREVLVMPACEDMGRPGYWSQHPEWGFAPAHDVLWPESWSYERLMAKKQEKLLKGDGGLWVMTYLCDPKRAEGRMFKRGWFRYGLPMEGPPVDGSGVLQEV